ncbi:MAG: hypothetical protein HOK65_03880 [Crocinitomicaceae bacterium]|nr:hypothetical protein [Crocinitomicaceae bacterium]
MEIKIKVQVKNADEILKVHKGGILGFFADVVLSKDKKQEKVEKAVCEQIVHHLKTEMPRRLEEEQVKTILEFEIVNNNDSYDVKAI